MPERIPFLTPLHHPMLAFALALLGGCKDVEEHDHEHDHDHGVVTRVELVFSPDGGGDALTFAWSDPENDGSPVVDDVVLPDASGDSAHVAQGYTLEVGVFNELEEPVEDVTVEIEEDAESHQFFFTGSAVSGPATGENAAAQIAQEYADEDAGGLPIGLLNNITTLSLGTGELTVTLRHMPSEGGEAVKVEGVAEVVAAEGFAGIGGDNDIQITFPLTVE